MTTNIFTYKYKPKILTDFHICNELLYVIETLIKIGKLNILLIGNSGTGKTTLIDAIIREYYGFDLPKDDPNVLSISNLKDQGISYYRNEVRTFCQTTSTIKGKHKVLLIDDIDSINDQGQQVFRNCIDKYSKNVFFIASCSNIQKVIDSIQSRLDIIKVIPHSPNELSTIASHIILNENISVEADVIPFIVNVCNGSIRTMINYLEKFKLINRRIDIDLASQLCTNISFKELERYTEKCLENNLLHAIDIMNSFVNKGYSVTDILDSYFSFIKHTRQFTEEQKYSIVPYICKYITIFHTIHEDQIELFFFTNNLLNLLHNA
jgi:DNA polymerase III delta prime subunit